MKKKTIKNFEEKLFILRTHKRHPIRVIWIRSQGFALGIQEACRVYHLDVIFKERQCCQNVTTRPSTPAPWRIAWTQLINTVSDRATVWCGRFVVRWWLAILCLSMWWHVCCVNSLRPVIIGSGNGLSPLRRQAITWNNDDALSMGSSMTYCNEIWTKMQRFSLK